MRILEIQRDGGVQRILTYLTPEEVEQLHGIPPQAVIGLLAGDDSMEVNTIFREFLQGIIAVAAPLDELMQSAAQTFGRGRLTYVDSRSPKHLYPIPNEDIIGWFPIRKGQIAAESYRPNPGYSIDGVYGLSEAIDRFRDDMVNELIARQTR